MCLVKIAHAVENVCEKCVEKSNEDLKACAPNGKILILTDDSERYCIPWAHIHHNSNVIQRTISQLLSCHRELVRVHDLFSELISHRLNIDI